jgi:hypothetical protein
MSQRAESFAQHVLSQLRCRDSRAGVLHVQRGGRTQGAVIGIMDGGEFVPLLMLDAASAAYNVMSLFEFHRQGWVPTLKRGTPIQLAELLAGPMSYLWTIAVLAQDFDEASSMH